MTVKVPAAAVTGNTDMGLPLSIAWKGNSYPMKEVKPEIILRFARVKPHAFYY